MRITVPSYIIVLLITVIQCSLPDKRTSVSFKDEFVLQDSLWVHNSVVGGLSGVDFDGQFFYFVVDDPVQPRILKASISFQKDTIHSIEFIETILVENKLDSIQQRGLDLESVLYDKKSSLFYLVSEGAVKEGISPSFFIVDAEGNHVDDFKLPDYFIKRTKHNASFEGMTFSNDKKGIWLAMEGVLDADGDEPSFHATNSPVRITLFNTISKKPVKQYVYQLDSIEKPKKGVINLNGITAIQSYGDDSFLVLERAYQSGYGSYGNTVKLYKATCESKTTNTLHIDSLSKAEYYPMKKELLLNFNSISSHFTKKIIDNLEGITFGPRLSNGNPSLLLVSDDNFQLYDPQLNQFILLELSDKN